MVYFGTEVRVTDVASFIIPIELVVGFFFLLIAAIMIGPGQFLGRRFAALPNSVEAYMVNVGGSLIGVLLFQWCSWRLSPIGWFGLVAAGLVFLLLRGTPRRPWAIVLSIVIPLVLLIPEHMALGVIREKFPVESWSPYYRINYSPETRTIVVNLLGHQNMVSRNDAFPAYAIPYLLNRDAGQPQFRDILVIGAGSGNDLSRALQWAATDARIDAVEIDPVIQSLGKRDHPDRPYQDPRITTHLGDGRNFLRSTNRRYDLIVFALIDSLVLHSSVSNIRLESYLFTTESMADVRRCLKADGLFVMYNYFRQGWIVSRLARTVEGVFGRRPLVLTLPYQDAITAEQRADGFTLLFEGPRTQAIERAFDQGTYLIKAGAAPSPTSPSGFGQPENGNVIRLSPTTVSIPADVRAAEDTWPFLYLRRPMIPDLVWRGMIVMGAISLLLLWLFGWRTGREQLTRLNTSMLLLGAGFMLLETKAVIHMALMFGSTWIVNTVVFAAILVMILLANLWVLTRKPASLLPYFVGLMAALALNVIIPLDSFLGLSKSVQSIVAGTLVLSPVFCAGVIFAMLFRKAPRPEQALAYNTAGAILGGLAESVSLLIGFKYLLVVAALIYLGACAVGIRVHPKVRRILEIPAA